jgi:hypothetical protein
MARFFINVNTTVAVDVGDLFVAEHAGNLDAIADEVINAYFAGDCEILDESLVDFASWDDLETTHSF